MYHQTFVVTGRSRDRFPMDMLRYDECWPQEPSQIPSPDSQEYTASVRMARYVSNETDQPTTARWDSFGWLVTNIVTRRA